jgi:hypothetical protein
MQKERKRHRRKKQQRCDLRIRKDIHRDLVPILIQSLLDIETPKQSRDREEGALLGQALTTADASTPSEGHVSFLVGEGSV